MNATTLNYIYTFMPLLVIVLIFWLFLIRPQKKKEKETKDMRNHLTEGDEIVTIGGIVGKILKVKDDTIVVYVGSDKTKMEFKKWAISEVTKKNEKGEKAQKEREQELEESVGENSKKIRKLSKKSDSEITE